MKATPNPLTTPSPALAPHWSRPSFVLAIALLVGCAGQSASTSAAPAPRVDEFAETFSQPRPIDAVDTPWLEDMTWLEVRDAIAAGKTTVIVPTGGIEENGPFLATGKHNVILEATCPVIARQLGNALCAPVVAFVPEGDIDPPTGAMRYPGSISLSDATYEALLTDICRSLRQAGFQDIVLIGDSGGNQRGMKNVADALNTVWAKEPTRAHFIRAYYSPGWEATEQYTAETLGVRETRSDGYHDDIWVTAMMMVIDPGQVRHAQRLDKGLASINGVSIEDVEATVALGKKMIEFRAGLTAEAIRESIAAATRASATD
ncbi:MAG: creatininase family protein [Pseudomonadota bacterium]